ncbi:apoptosis-stimulating of p53 protein 2b isoform X1 [Alosa sapidissima]|uniref:apoptosis-stimulating of p53 protein 2b isoform X1 n=1 Tax=Alosa sapidissima TaxID=34773 RepID=UPI001C09497E|nr:apoptosis-stimulating of p53 protein 2b isoform X1 [Alosa sapidissima]
MRYGANMMPMFLTVYLSNNDKHFTEVPVTPETLCRDVVDLCKEPGEGHCYLAEMWRGSERGISEGERMMDILQRWGQQRGEVRFYLRHDRAPNTSGGQRGPEVPPKRNSVKNTTERRMENGVTPPTVNATLTELQEMASRQQQQINAQQQLLASKEQRLRFLKQQQQQQQSEQEKLRLLRENAEHQESKLRRVRALRGQVEQKRLSNSKLVEEIDQMTALFQQKQRELVVAVSRVEELGRQLEALRSGKVDAPGPDAQGQSSQAAADLERLYKELQLRNRLNQEQSAKLQQQRDTLSKRNLEVVAMDKRISELRERLWKKKAALQHKENLPQPPAEGPVSHHALGSRVAAVEPYIQQNPPAPPIPPRQEVIIKPRHPDGTATLPLPNGQIKSQPRLPAKPHVGKGKLSDWSSSSTDSTGHHGYSSTLPRMTSHPPLEQDSDADLRPPPLPLRRNQSNEDLLRDPQNGKSKVPPPVPSKPKAPPPAPPSSSSSSSSSSSTSFSRFTTGTFPGKARPVNHPSGSDTLPPSSSARTLPLPLPPKPKPDPNAPSLTPAATVHPFTPDPLPSAASTSAKDPAVSANNTPPLSRPQIVAASSIYSMYTQQSTPGGKAFNNVGGGTLPRSHPRERPAWKAYPDLGGGTLPRFKPRVYGKPVLPSTGGQQHNPPDGSHGDRPFTAETEVDHAGSTASSSSSSAATTSSSGDAPPAQQETTDRAPRPLSPTKLLPFLSQPFRHQSDVDLEALRKRLHHAPRPLKKRSSITEPEGPAGPNIQKLLYQKTTLAAMETTTVVVGTATPPPPPFFQPSPSSSSGPQQDAGRGGPGNGAMTATMMMMMMMKDSGGLTVSALGDDTTTTIGGRRPTESPCTIIPERVEEEDTRPEEEEEEEFDEDDLTPPPLPPRSPILDDLSMGGLHPHLPPPLEDERELDPCAPTPLEGYMDEYPPYPPPPYPSQVEQEPQVDESSMEPPEITGEMTLPPGKRTNLRKTGSERINHGMRVRFNPLALLLDSSLEGEYDLVQRIIYEVDDPSLPNDEGITALHNSVCAGHTEIVKFLVQFGVNVNAADSDGWTPLHCAASCNNVQVCKFLVESGAAVFAVTHSDMQTAADKCEEMEEGYAQCSQFLYGVQEKMGIMNRGVVYGLWDYEAETEDELSFREGDCMTVLRREDQEETQWWWARCGDKEGYIPRNLLGLYLRIKPRQRSLA